MMFRLAIILVALSPLLASCGGGGGAPPVVTLPPPEDELVTPQSPVVPDDLNPTVSTLGAYEIAPIDDVGNDFTAVFHRWGVWGGILRDDAVTCTAIGCPPAGDTIFMAYMNHEIDGTVSRMTQGTWSGTSPVTGSAVWAGDVVAYETEDIMTSGGTSATAYSPVEGDARLEVDFAATAVDVDFANFDNGRADISWGRACHGERRVRKWNR